MGLFRWMLFLVSVTLLSNCQQANRPEYTKLMGLAQGTTWQITYKGSENRKGAIDSLLLAFDMSLSTYRKDSRITALNENTSTEMDALLQEVVETGIRICRETEGAFDMTVAPVVNAWGFGFKNKETITPQLIDSLLQFTGCGQISINGNQLVKASDAVLLNVNAIAQGYSVDVVARFLEEEGIQNYMVEIGGEIKTKGTNPDGKKWQIGLNKPIDDSLSVKSEIQTVLSLTDLALATSGNYRKFYIENGVKYSHTIDPRTGYPVEHSLLSATVVGESGMEADALATAFMVMGKEKALKFLETRPHIQAYFISEDSFGNYEIDYTPGFEALFRAD